MENEIFLSVQKLLNGRLYTSIDQYKSDLSDTVDALYLDTELKKEIRRLYSDVLTSRRALSGLGYICFTDKVFGENVGKFLVAVNNLFQYLFSITNRTGDAVCLEIIKQIVEDDVEPAKDEIPGNDGARKIYIKIGNPVVLESLAVTFNQIFDFDHLGFIDSFTQRYKSRGNTPYDLNAANILYCEILENKVERLFRDLVILYNDADCRGDRQETYRKNYYRIVGYDDDTNRFVAVHESDLSSIEPFNALKLYDKIVNGQKNNPMAKKTVIVGSPQDGTLPLLESMLDTRLGGNAPHASELIDRKTGRDEIRNIITNSCKMKELLNGYDKIFILDCPEIYSDILMERLDNNYSLMFNTPGEAYNTLGIDEKTRIRDFDNNSKFVKIYYRVQNYLVDKYTLSGRKIRILNRRFLDFMSRMFAVDKNGEIVNPDNYGKEVYVYYSDDLCFRQSAYDMYDFTCLEEHNYKTCHVVKFSHTKGRLSQSRDKKIRFSYFKLLETLSTSGIFYRDMTGDFVNEGRDEPSKVLDAVYIAQNINICIDYSGQNPEVPNQKCWSMPLQITVTLPGVDRHGIKMDRNRKERCKAFIWLTLSDAFYDFKKNKDIENVVLFDSFHKNFANVILGAAKSYNDILFLHLYKRMLEVGDIYFHIYGQITNSDILVRRIDETYEEDLLDYSGKRTACRIMNVLDAESYRESENVRLTQQASFNRCDLSEYTNGLKEACENMRYTDSNLYLRLKKYY